MIVYISLKLLKMYSHQFNLAQKDGCKVIFTQAREEELLSQFLGILLKGKDILKDPEWQRFMVYIVYIYQVNF